jgi:hypothetical protein
MPVSKWHELFEDSTVADAIIDSLVHNAYCFELKGPTKRRGDLHEHGEKENKGNNSSPSITNEESAAKHLVPKSLLIGKPIQVKQITPSFIVFFWNEFIHTIYGVQSDFTKIYFTVQVV